MFFFIEGPGVLRHLVDSENDPNEAIGAVLKNFVSCLNFEAADCLRGFYCFYWP